MTTEKLEKDEKATAKPEAPSTPGELLLAAAEALERKRGPREPKTYRMLAAEVRALAEKLDGLS